MYDIQKVLVLGASADQGLPLVSALLNDGADVVAGVRRPDAMKATPYADIPSVHADIDDSSVLERAFSGVDAVAMHLPFKHDVELAASYGQNITVAAKKAGVKKLVFNTSCFVADQDLELTGHDGRRRIEQAIRESGIDYVILRPVVFMDNAIRAWLRPAVVNDNTFAYPASDTLKISWICLEDLGKLISRATLTPDVRCETITVGGPEALTGHDVADRLSQASGRKIDFRSLEPLEFAQNMSELVTGSREVAPGSVYWGMSKFYNWYNDQPVSPLDVNPDSFLDRLPVKLTSYGEWATKQDWG